MHGSVRFLAWIALWAACSEAHREPTIDKREQALAECKAQWNRLVAWSSGRDLSFEVSTDPLVESPSAKTFDQMRQAVPEMTDPWGKKYFYTYVDRGSGIRSIKDNVEVKSTGPDGVPFTEDDVSYPQKDCIWNQSGLRKQR